MVWLVLASSVNEDEVSSSSLIVYAVIFNPSTSSLAVYSVQLY